MLREALLNIVGSYPDYRALQTVNKAAPLYRVVIETVPSLLEDLLSDTSHILFEGSTGRGNITSAPWIATFDERVTTSATKGFYPVYLYSTDLKRLFLSLAFGTTQFTEFYGNNARAFKKIEDAAKRFYAIQAAAFPKNWQVGPIDLAASSSHKLHRSYEHCAIASVSYQTDDLPTNAQLADDYRAMMSLYRMLVESPLTPSLTDLLEESAETPKADELVPVVTAFVPRPAPSKTGSSRGGGNNRRSAQSQKVGRAGEQAVLAYEKKKLIDAGREDLAAKVVWEDEKANYPGWDISSFEVSGAPICIEVKSTTGNTITNVELTANEWRAAENEGKKYKIYLVTKALKASPIIEVLEDPCAYVSQGQLKIETAVFKLSLCKDPNSPS
ncbi:DUF3578 domain-containing protein [Thalassospira sp.]|uniref:MrcB family domain-containing protein n=1 Tax=Thalassospira sp. TaxID=1912094 RepID=UPI0026222F89|nr:DUF3578 domain-containing protein [Thalassospira sp.]MCH2277007.1 DUF3578 domain-containing protein [Thalassospira sp.]